MSKCGSSLTKARWQKEHVNNMKIQCSFVCVRAPMLMTSQDKTQTKTQTTPDSVFARERRNSDHGLSFWGRKISSVQTRGIVKTSRFIRGAGKNRSFFIYIYIYIFFFFSGFSSGAPRTSAPEKIKTPRNSPERRRPPETRQKGGFFRAPPFTMHLVCTQLKKEGQFCKSGI